MKTSEVIGGVVFLFLLLIGIYLIYDGFLSEKIGNLNIINSNPDLKKEIENLPFEVKQFYDKMRFNHNEITYYVNSQCPPEKRNRLLRAFEIIKEETTILSFKETSEENADILVGCSRDSYEKEKNIFVGGEGGPTRIVNSSFSVITKGKILLYNESRSICEKPILEIHELLHVLGYDHIKDKTNIMYSYLDCKQELKQEHITHIKELYSVQQFANLFFESVSGSKLKYAGNWYINFNVSISNNGIIDAKETKLVVYADEESIETFELETINFGGGKNFYVSNLLIPLENSTIELELTTSTYDSKKDDNTIILNIG